MSSSTSPPPDSPRVLSYDEGIGEDAGHQHHQQEGNVGISSSVVSEQSSSNHPQIRHAGRAHVRGKIRRIWRPRYLELWDNALLRYYELPASADIALQSDKDWDHYNMISKYTLAVFHARILDATTLRDMHVGLPQASFGFVFRGQRLTHFETQHGGTALIFSTTTPAMTAASLNPMNVKCGMEKEVPMPEQRDFFCAVSSLEEAQSWVIALQWAASAHAELPQEPWWKQEGEEDSDDSDLVMVRSGGGISASSSPVGGGSTTSSSLSHRHKQQESTATGGTAGGGAFTSEFDDPSKETVLRVPPTGASTKHRRSPHRHRHRGGGSGGGFGKVVVSKVVQYRIVRLTGLNFEIAYEIHGMLLRQRVSQQWSMLRTADDLHQLVTELCKELGPSLLDRAQLGPIRRLPRFRDKPSPASVQKSLSVVDSILRSLVMDAAMVNTNAMKSFLGLTAASASTPTSAVSSAQQQQPQAATSSSLVTFVPSFITTGWLQAHDASAIIERKAETLPEHIATDHYVKTWLQADRNNRSASSTTTTTTTTKASKSPSGTNTVDSYVVLFWQRPLVYLGAAGLSATALVPLSQLWQQLFVPRITVRVDALLVSWAGAAYLGKLYHENVTASSSSSMAAVSRSRRKPSHGAVAGAPVPTVLKSSPAKPTVQRGAVDAAADKPGALAQQEEDEEEDVYSGSLEESDGEEMVSVDEESQIKRALSSPLPERRDGNEDYEDSVSCWSKPEDSIFHVRGINYLQDRIKFPSDAAPLTCRGVDVWITDEPMRNISRHPDVLGGKLGDEDTFLVNFLLPFGNFVSYFSVPPLHKFPKKLKNVWTKFLKGDQQYRDARLKLLPVVADGPWIVKTAVGPGKSPALLGKVIPLQYFFRDPDRTRKGVYEVDVIITASTIAKGILSVVKGHTNYVSIAFAFIIEAAEQADLPETVLCSFQIHKLNLEDCPLLPECDLDNDTESSSA